MAAAVAFDASPISFVRALRGAIVDARLAHPDVLHVVIRDSREGIWRLASQDASCSPSDPASLIGRSVEEVQIDDTSRALRCLLSDGSTFMLEPALIEAEDDPPNWELISPGGIVLEFGPGLRWQFSTLDAKR